jgi:hypothetical protein
MQHLDLKGESVHCGQVDWVACFVSNPCELQIKSIHGQMEFLGMIWGLALFVNNLT